MLQMTVSRRHKLPGIAHRVTLWLMTFCLTLPLASLGAESIYFVKRNDTLYSIARLNGVSVPELADRNGISHTTRVYVGQRLVIPSKTAQAGSVSSLAAPVQKAIDTAPVAPRRWKYIVIHHSGVNEGNVKALDQYHRRERHMENGLAYHFLIGNGNGMGDGEIGVGNRWRKQLDGGHLRSEEQNKIAIGICLIGNFERTKPTKKQLESLENLIRALMKRCSLTASAIKTHQQINVVRTECPGRKFPTRSFLADLKKPKS